MLPIWRTIGIRNFNFLSVCRVVETGLVDISFLGFISQRTCLNGDGDYDPLHITLYLEQNTPNDLINRPLEIVLVNGTCQFPINSSAPVTITSKWKFFTHYKKKLFLCVYILELPISDIVCEGWALGVVRRCL